VEVGGRLSEVRGRPLMASRPLAAVVGRLSRRGRRGGVGVTGLERQRRAQGGGAGGEAASSAARSEAAAGDAPRSGEHVAQRRAGPGRPASAWATRVCARRGSERLRGVALAQAGGQCGTGHGSGERHGHAHVARQGAQRHAARRAVSGSCARTRVRVASWRRARVPRRGSGGGRCARQAGLGQGAAQGGLARSRVRSRERGCACGREAGRARGAGGPELGGRA